MPTFVRAVVLVLLCANRIEAQELEVYLFASEPAGGQIVADFDSTLSYPLFLSVCAGTACLYSGTNPGFMTPARPDTTRQLYPIAPRTRLTLELLEITPGASVKIGAVLLRAPGDRAVLGDAPTVHLHPSWQATAPRGASGTFSVRFRVLGSNPYAPSAPYTLQFHIAGAPTPTATTTATATLPTEPTVTRTPSPSATTTPTHVPPATATATSRPTVTATPTPTDTPIPSPTAPPIAGDLNCDGRATAADVVAFVRLASALPSEPLCVGDILQDGTIDEGDRVRLLTRIFGQE